VPESVRWGPDSAHTLSQKTELVWDDKYDEYGARRPVEIAGSAMSMEKIETVDMPEAKPWPMGSHLLWVITLIQSTL
jgi:adenine-specific DNA-methyltransferase